MKRIVLLSACFGLLLAIGCSQQSGEEAANSPSNDVSVDGSKYVLNEQPEDAKEVIAAREAAADGDEVVVVGRIGGDVNPWIENRAAFSIVDNSLRACSDIPGDECPTPWDYCCETDKLATGTALVKVVDADGQLIKTDARKLLPVKELSTVVVRGKAQRDDAGNLTVLADGVYVQK